MVKYLPIVLLYSVILLLTQVLILNNIYLWGYINPFIYIFVIIMLPFEFTVWVSLVIAFLLGISVDFFSNTPGLHTAATLTMTYFRPSVLRLIAPREGYDSGTKPEIKEQGVMWYLRYTGFMVLIHHIFLFYLEVFSFSSFFETLFRVFVSWIFSMILIILIQFLIQKPNN
ncbi:MAG: rod shape-determining protein MreD [Bacteroidetes bacterium HGW-Bacteroidetes-21]|nr:MAG: rod shape-determining protein MreD [Bacteroidetes bacterium HGW-Bacteroidetes-21]